MQVQKSGVDPETIIRMALELLSNPPVYDFDDLDEETKAAIEKSEAEFSRGEFLTVAQVREQLQPQVAPMQK